MMLKERIFLTRLSTGMAKNSRMRKKNLNTRTYVTGNEPLMKNEDKSKLDLLLQVNEANLSS